MSQGNCAELLPNGSRFRGTFFCRFLAATAEAAVGPLCREQAFLGGNGTLGAAAMGPAATQDPQAGGTRRKDAGHLLVTAHVGTVGQAARTSVCRLEDGRF